eukprot:TRINITY_DN156_c0_g1_i1.p1 TRINITY_DN156_c0_g1~~TRINITY_DN156_c0_g1_i1.p1  ORF type:complete len:274 (-),score=46.03 TRINITY_DN156_c0_g1_i1:300-1121(-)
MEALLVSSTGVAKLARGVRLPTCKFVCCAPVVAASRIAAFTNPGFFRQLPMSSSAPTSRPPYSSSARGGFVPRAGVAYESQGAARTLAPITIYTAATGEPVKFEDLWDQKDGLALVVFLRHFGCPFCWEFAKKVKEIKPQLDALGVKLVTVGVGKPDKARILVEKLGYPLENLYCDDERRAYNALELTFGVQSTFLNPSIPIKALGKLNELKDIFTGGYVPSSTDNKDGVLQQGGVYIFKGQEVLYGRKDEHAGDHPDLGDILDILNKAPSYA